MSLHLSRKFCDEFAKHHKSGRFLSFLTRTWPSDRQPLPLAMAKLPEDSHFVSSGFFLTVFSNRNVLTKPGLSVYVSCLVADMETQQIPQSYQVQGPGRKLRQPGCRLSEGMTSGTALAYSTADHLFWLVTDVRIAGNEFHIRHSAAYQQCKKLPPEPPRRTACTADRS